MDIVINFRGQRSEYGDEYLPGGRWSSQDFRHRDLSVLSCIQNNPRVTLASCPVSNADSALWPKRPEREVYHSRPYGARINNDTVFSRSLNYVAIELIEHRVNFAFTLNFRFIFDTDENIFPKLNPKLIFDVCRNEE
jgi:hypothetical protein